MVDAWKPTLEAINSLEAKYPYAATVLGYVVLERLLKLHLLRNRMTLTAEEVDFDKKVGRKGQRLGDARDLDDKSFIQRFLLNCALGDLEDIYKIRPKGRYSKDRNGVFHSNLYLVNQLESDYQSRDAQNRAYLKKAKEHLVEASGLYFPQWTIVELRGQLQFKG